MPCFTCGKACERDLFVSSIPWLSTKTIVVSSNNIHTVTLFQAIFSIDSLFDNVRHIFKTLNDVTPLWKRSKDANAPASQLKPSDSPPPPPRRYDRGIHFLRKQKQVNSLFPRGQLNGKPLIFSTRWGIFYGWWRCWGQVMSPTMVAILDFTKN